MYLMYKVYMMETKCLGRIQAKVKFKEIEFHEFISCLAVYIAKANSLGFLCKLLRW